MYKGQQKLQYKKKVQIKSLEAAICNVALFKNMKDIEFKDSIFISYCEEGVILEAKNEYQWKKAQEYIRNFLDHKKISELAYGYEKEEYEELINRGLKEYTRRIKEKNQQCPYINIIHFQKLRKSCQFMNKEKYVEPLKDWQKKNKKHPNFAFLIVQPKNKFEEVKRSLLQSLTGKLVPLTIHLLDPIYYLYLFFNSPLKEKVRQAHHKKLLDICIVDSEKQKKIEVANFTEIEIDEYMYTIVEGNKNTNKWGLEYITAKQLREEFKNAKLYCRENPASLLQTSDQQLINEYQQNYSLIPYKKKEEEKYKSIINKFSNMDLSKVEIIKKMQKNVICNISDIEFIHSMYESDTYKASKVCINYCPYMVHEYDAAKVDFVAFLIYLQQLTMYYCTYLVRFYGIAIKYKPISSTKSKEPQIQSVYLIFDFHKCNLAYMLENDMILDNMQIGTMMLQLLYLLKFLHQHDQPRCLGSLSVSQICWPMAIVLPYLGATNDDQGAEGDIKQVGQLMKGLLGNESTKEDDFEKLLNSMIEENKYDRPGTDKCIEEFEQILCL